MNALLSDLSPYILAGVFGLVGWYLRSNAKQHEALVDAVQALGKTISALEQKLEDKVDIHARRFEKYTLSQEARLTELETRCSYEHGKMVDRRRSQQVMSWQENSDLGHGVPSGGGR